MIRIIIIGAAGRMGRLLVKNVISSNDMQLTGAVEHNKNPLLGQDSGLVAGTTESGIQITSDLRKLISSSDVVIDFSTGTIVNDAQLSVESGLNVIIGTTALSDEDKTHLQGLADNGGKIVFAPNMSIGVNLLFHLVSEVSKTLSSNYEIEIVEMHHNQKKDAPSGTAVKLAEIAAEARNLDLNKHGCYGRHGITGIRPKNEIGIHTVRGGDVIGDHTVIFAANGERVELTHKATNRETFALGALEAVRFLKNAKSGLYSMQDVLGL